VGVVSGSYAYWYENYNRNCFQLSVGHMTRRHLVVSCFWACQLQWSEWQRSRCEHGTCGDVSAAMSDSAPSAHTYTLQRALHTSLQKFISTLCICHKLGITLKLKFLCFLWLYSKTRCSAIAERLRCRVRYSFGQKWKTGTGRQYFTDIIGLSSTTVAWKSIEFGEKTQNKGYYGVQDHSRSSRSVPIKSPYAT